MNCPFCKSAKTRRHGTRYSKLYGYRKRWLCKACGRTFYAFGRIYEDEPREKTIRMRAAMKIRAAKFEELMSSY